MGTMRRKPTKRKSLIQRETTKRNGRILYYATKYSNDPNMVAAKKHMEHKAYGVM